MMCDSMLVRVRSVRPLLCFAAAIVWLLLPMTGAAAGERCGLCRRELGGTYTSYTPHGGGAELRVCEDCDLAKPRCAVCNIPTNERAEGGRPVLCRHCTQEAQWCAVCGGLIRGRYAEYRQKDGTARKVCDACEKAMPRCVSCRVPHAPADLQRVKDGKLWCADCLARAERCNLCNGPLTGLVYTLDNHEGKWCAACFTERPRCDICMAPMEKPAARIVDGRKMCSECFGSAVRGTNAMRDIAEQVMPVIRDITGGDVNLPPVRAVGREELEAAFAETRHPGGDVKLPGGVAGPLVKELGAFRARGPEREILILDILPEDLAWETIAHEMAHAWQNQHYPRCDDAVLAEGFAQWVSEGVCYRAWHRRGLEKLRTREDFYGQAFRAIQQIETRDGLDGILAALERNELPDGISGK